MLVVDVSRLQANWDTAGRRELWVTWRCLQALSHTDDIRLVGRCGFLI
jgi:hypothetical protein